MSSEAANGTVQQSAKNTNSTMSKDNSTDEEFSQGNTTAAKLKRTSLSGRSGNHVGRRKYNLVSKAYSVATTSLIQTRKSLMTGKPVTAIPLSVHLLW